MITAIWIFLGLVIVAFIVVFVIQATGLFRTRSYKGAANRSDPEPSLNTSDRSVDDRLASPKLQNEGEDPRGADVGGNFSDIPNRGDASNENQR